VREAGRLSNLISILKSTRSFCAFFFGTGVFLKLVDTDVVVGPAGKEVGSVFVPDEGGAAKFLGGVQLVCFH